MRKVRCVSPHGGAHNGMDHNGNPVPFGVSPDPEKLRLPPNPGGYIDVPSLGAGRFVPVGAVIEVPDDFTGDADGFHFEPVTEPGDAPVPDAAAAAAEEV